MTVIRMGKTIALVSATALMLAACSKKEQVGAQVEEQPVQQERVKSAAELEIEQWGHPTADGLAYYAGADRVFFAYDSSELSSEARMTLDKQAQWLGHYGQVSVTIEGHCDERGTREYNLALGDRRAQAVVNYLVAQGVSADRLKSISYGKERPAVVGNGESAWSQNRRGVLAVD
ncbi:peptidoglycan-associated lipoprotein Pal [Pseudokordiimonas caeni]|uniref:peptidoglycan-associated lipoprotein Pal n=1 Tax=Pseudokordiimonas caeni TaxID=2997908 RepID=UPI00281268CD|nr:peptidoglycan-associated lipoprotein Pal [Pseudokordiimonas caeni]